MTAIFEDSSGSVFKIDQTDIYSEYIHSNRQEILITLRALEKRHTIVTLYLDEGAQFFLSSIIAVDESSGLIFLDPSNQPKNNKVASLAKKITLSSTLDRVKIQMRLSALSLCTLANKPAFSAALPTRILRLQRRQFFRLETPHISPLRCKMTVKQEDGIEVFDFLLFDISGGGLSLIAKADKVENFLLGELIPDCQLEIPGESVLLVNLRIRGILKMELPNGDQQLRLGCEFVSLPRTRLTLIERYITRLERERKAKSTGL